MIQRNHVIERLIKACPSFNPKWEEHLQDIWDRTSETILYTDLTEFARHLIELVKKNELDAYDDIFCEIEHLLREGEPFVQEAITIGLLEDFQNFLLSSNYEFDIIEKFIKPETKRQWNAIIKMWDGGTSQ